MIIRKAEVKDATFIAQISVDTWKDTYKGLIDENILNGRKVDDKRISWVVENIKNPDFTILVYEDKEILGYLWAGPTRDKQEIKNELYAIYVKKSAQRKGIGSKLIEEYKQIINNETFYLYMLKNNVIASTFYDKAGGVVCEKYNRQLDLKNQVIEEVCYVFEAQ